MLCKKTHWFRIGCAKESDIELTRAMVVVPDLAYKLRLFERYFFYTYRIYRYVSSLLTLLTPEVHIGVVT